MTKTGKFDVIVVGSGPGGATVARELSRSGKKVLLAEWGGHRAIKGTLFQATVAASIPGKSMLFTPDFASVFRGIISGGSSVFYYGTAFDPPLAMFKKYGVDLAEEVQEIKEELPVKPLDDSLIGAMASRIMNSAQELGYDWQKLPKFIYQDRCEAKCWKCAYGCPVGAKWSARHYVDQALDEGATLVTKTKVKKVMIHNGRAIGVESIKNGIGTRFEAPLVVVSAGGIGTPVILNNSGIKGSGDNYFFDPLIAVMGTVSKIKDGGKEIPMATGLHMEDEGYLMTDMTVPGTLFRMFNAQAFKPHKMLSHAKSLTIMIKAKDDLGGQLSARGGVKKKIEATDRNKLQKGFERAKKILENAGAKNIYHSAYLAAHPGGTAKIGQVVDNNLQTEIDNLYVCDCSVIPEAWGLPPTLTLVALGKRLAKHLSN